jgi:hypothetical protein
MVRHIITEKETNKDDFLNLFSFFLLTTFLHSVSFFFLSVLPSFSSFAKFILSEGGEGGGGWGGGKKCISISIIDCKKMIKWVHVSVNDWVGPLAAYRWNLEISWKKVMKGMVSRDREFCARSIKVISTFCNVLIVCKIVSTEARVIPSRDEYFFLRFITIFRCFLYMFW